MAYRALYHKSVEKALAKLDEARARRVIKLISERICEGPRSGKPLKGRYKRLSSYRLGSYRVIYLIDESAKTIRVLKIGERQSVYDDLFF